MNMKYLLLIIIIIFSIAIVGCDSEMNNNTNMNTKMDDNEQTTSSKDVSAKGETMDDESAFSKISDAIKSKKAVKCTISMTDGEDSMDMTYWLKDDNMKTMTSVGGKEQIFIQKDDEFYMPASSYGVDSDCDWIKLEGHDEEDYDDDESEYDEYESNMDYESYEDNSAYKVSCTPSAFGNSMFDTPGKVCSMKDIMGAMMEGFNMDDMDMGDFN